MENHQTQSKPADAELPSPEGLSSSALFGLAECPLHRRTPFGMTNVSMTQLSIARHYGGITFQGEEYTYIPTTDELIRNDVMKWQRKHVKKSLPNTYSGTDVP